MYPKRSWMSTLRLPGINAGACSGLTLSGVFHTVLKDGAWRRRMGQETRCHNHQPVHKYADTGDQGLLVEAAYENSIYEDHTERFSVV